MQVSDPDPAHLWVLIAGDGRRIGVLSADAVVPVALSRMGRGWDLANEQPGLDDAALDALVVAVGSGDDPQSVLGAHVDPETLIGGGAPDDVTGPATFIPRSAGLDELVDGIERMLTVERPGPVTSAGHVSDPVPAPDGSEQRLRERFRDRMVDRLLGDASTRSSGMPPAAGPPAGDRDTGGQTAGDHDASASLAVRVERAARTIPDLVQLLREQPVLRSRQRVLGRLLDLCHDRLALETIGVWQRGPSHWDLTVGRGLVDDPTVTRVPIDEPLFVELDEIGGSVLLPSVGDASGPVSGIPQMDAGSFAGVSLRFDGDRHGVLAFGRRDPLTADDVQWVQQVVDEAMVALAVAAGIERLLGARQDLAT